MNHADRLRQIADTQNVRLFPLICDDLRAAADLIEHFTSALHRIVASGAYPEAAIAADALEAAPDGSLT